jgi:hypothetical protein
MNFNRVHPSPRYTQLMSMYAQMHIEGEKFLGVPPEQTFPGQSLFAQATRIKKLIDLTSATTIMDYGCGKGYQYNPTGFAIKGLGQWPSVLDYWDIDAVHCYDPCYPTFSKLPSGKFDGVISTDVLEHCPEEDMVWIVEEIFGYARRFVFANVACYPAKKRLPSGENCHCTIREPGWWQALFSAVAEKHPEIIWEVWVQFESETPKGVQRIEQRLGGAI